MICTLAGADLDVVHCSRSSLCLLLVDGELNELNGVCQKECPQTNKKAFRRHRDLVQAGVRLMALPTDICVPLLSCSRLVKLLLSAAPFFGGKVPFINTKCCRENDCFEKITLSFPFTNTQSTFHFTCTLFSRCLRKTVKWINLTLTPSSRPNFSCFPSTSLLNAEGSAFE